MKKFLLMPLGALLALPAFARDFTYEYEGTTITYTVIDENAKTCRTKAGVVTIDEYGWKGVTTPGHTGLGEADVILPEHPMDGNITFTLTEIGDASFCTLNREDRMGSIQIPNTVTYIGDFAFTGMSSRLHLPESLQYIGDYAFLDSWIGEGIKFPESLTHIGECAFADCGFMAIELPESLAHIGRCAFAQSNLRKANIPGSVKEFGDGIFTGCENLYFVTLSQELTEIPSGLFYACLSLPSIDIPENVTSIGESAFAECRSLASIDIPDNVESIGFCAFENCSALTTLKLPSKLKELGYYAWSGCDNIKEIDYQSENPVTHDSKTVFEDSVYENATLNVPEGKREVFETVSPWKYFSNIKEKDNSGVSGVEIDDTLPYSIHNMNGQYVGNDINGLTPGLYIVRKGESVSKITVK